MVNNYQELLDRFHNKELDMVQFGGFTFVKALNQDQAVPLVMRDVDARFVSYYLVSSKSTARSINEFKGKRFGFGSNLSTSGHLMPRYFMQQQEIIPEQFFSDVQYSGAHDRTAQWVAEEKIDLGVANAVVIDKFYQQNKISRQQVLIIQQTPPYADYVWAAQLSLPEPVKAKIVNAFLRLSKTNKTHAQILDKLGANYYLSTGTDDF